MVVLAEGRPRLSLFPLFLSVLASYRRQRCAAGRWRRPGAAVSSGSKQQVGCGRRGPPLRRPQGHGRVRGGRERGAAAGWAAAVGWAASLRPAGCEGAVPFPAGPAPTAPLRLASGLTKDQLPGPYPRTAEERAAAAKKYNMRVEDYQPYPNDGFG